MSAGRVSRDLVVLVADKNMEFATRGILSRPRSLRIRAITFDVHVHVERDPGCFLKAAEFLRSFQSRYKRALVLFDREGCGRVAETRSVLERQVEDRLGASGWRSRAAAVVIDPELENWVWSASPQVDQHLGWAERVPDLRSWLRKTGYLQADEPKPARPEEAMEAALRETRKPRSSAIFERLAKVVSLTRCEDAAFAKLQSVLREWFPAE